MTTNRSDNRRSGGIGLRQQVLLAAFECSGGDSRKLFTAEDLLLAAWKRDPVAWGLRGHEKEHPDSEKIYKELDRVSIKGRNVRGGLAGLGLLERVRIRTYRLTPTGLTEASRGIGADPSVRATAERALSDAMEAIISHPVFQDWLRDPSLPKRFRDAGHFWGVAPGTPPGVVRSRVAEIDRTLQNALMLLDEKGVTEISVRHGKALFDRTDVQRAVQFHACIKERFSRDLDILQGTVTEKPAD